MGALFISCLVPIIGFLAATAFKAQPVMISPRTFAGNLILMLVLVLGGLLFARPVEHVARRALSITQATQILEAKQDKRLHDLTSEMGAD
jgi:hypothetical protein